METEMTEYPTPAPVFADADHEAEILGEAKTADEAMAIYRDFFDGTGAVPVSAVKTTPERSGRPVDGWLPVTTDDPR